MSKQESLVKRLKKEIIALRSIIEAYELKIVPMSNENTSLKEDVEMLNEQNHYLSKYHDDVTDIIEASGDETTKDWKSIKERIIKLLKRERQMANIFKQTPKSYQTQDGSEAPIQQWCSKTCKNYESY